MTDAEEKLIPPMERAFIAGFCAAHIKDHLDDVQELTGLMVMVDIPATHWAYVIADLAKDLNTERTRIISALLASYLKYELEKAVSK